MLQITWMFAVSSVIQWIITDLHQEKKGIKAFHIPLHFQGKINNGP